jgi:hypothetical protein
MKFILMAGLLVPTGLAFATPITIISATGGQNGQAILASPVGESWTQTGAYTGVTISANLIGGAGKTATAYLMNQIGPGTTALNEVTAPFLISDSIAASTSITLFSGLTLSAGTYYLLIDGTNAPNPLGWPGTISPTYTEDGGVSGVQELGVSGTEASFSPASTFSTTSTAVFFTVTGTPGATSTAPEPGTLAMLGVGCAGLIVVARRRRTGSFERIHN